MNLNGDKIQETPTIMVQQIISITEKLAHIQLSRKIFNSRLNTNLNGHTILAILTRTVGPTTHFYQPSQAAPHAAMRDNVGRSEAIVAS